MTAETRGLAILAAASIIGGILILRGLIHAIRDAHAKRLEDAKRFEQKLYDSLFPGMSVPDLDMPHGMWPTCGTPPCDWEEGWTCHAHRPVSERVGKHRAVWDGSLDNQTAEVILAVVTDCENRRQS